MYKYLYKIEYVGKNNTICKYYIGSRKSKDKPEDDLLKKYMTSSKIIKKIIKEEGVKAFKINEMKIFPEDSNILHEEAKWLRKVNAKDNKEYFNQHNNEAYIDKTTVNTICPWCYKKNYGNPFEKCLYCGESMIRYRCKREGCDGILDHPNHICEKCGYSASKNANYRCKQCNERIENPSQVCKVCGYSPMKNCNVNCEKCGEKLNYNIERCTNCGYSKVDSFKYYCNQCGNILKHKLERCPKCNYFARDDFKYKCQKCYKPIESSISRCPECNYSILDDVNYKCKQCNAILENPMERCSNCGDARRDSIKLRCKNCGAEGLSGSSSKCNKCGITKAGCDGWKKFNEMYDLKLDDEIIFSGSKNKCIEFLEENLIVDKRHLTRIKFFEGNKLEARKKARKYINKNKFIGLVAIKNN